MTKMDKPSAFSRRALLKAPARSWSRSARRSASIRVLALNTALRAGRQAAAACRTSSTPRSRSRRRHGLGLLRQDGHGPGPVRRHRPDRRRRARRAVQGRHGVHGRHRDQLTRAAPRAPPASSSAAGRCARRRRKRAACWSRWRRQKLGMPADELTVTDGVVSDANRSGEEDQLCRAHRRALFQRPARLEQAVGQPALRARQGAAEEARASTRSSASRSRARTWRRKCSARGLLSPTSTCRAWCMAA